MNREGLIKQLCLLSGPLGPFVLFDTWTQQKEDWIKTFHPGQQYILLQTLLDLIINPPLQTELSSTDIEDFNLNISQLLTLLGRDDPNALIEKIGPLVTNATARKIIIEVIGSLKQADGIRWLTPLLESTYLTTEELIVLACALGEIGGLEARSLLLKMHAETSSDKKNVLKEIEIALKSA